MSLIKSEQGIALVFGYEILFLWILFQAVAQATGALASGDNRIRIGGAE